MDKNAIISVLEEWNFWRRDQFTGVARDYYLNKLSELSTTNQVIMITGARRSGKSTILRQYAKNLMDKGIPPENILFINFEDPRLGELNAQSLQELYEVYKEFLHPQGISYIFLDEIHEVLNWEKWVRTMHELRKAVIFVSGSNAKLLSQDLANVLTGRHIDLTVLPLSFKEILHFNNIIVTQKLEIIVRKREFQTILSRFMDSGGFPEVILLHKSRELLLQYFDDVLTKDMIRRYNIRKSVKLKSLANYYFTAIGSTITFNAIEKKMELTADTAEKFSTYFEDSYLFFFLKRFSYKVRAQEKSPRKVYSIDTGLVHAVGFLFSQNKGRIMENVVFLDLLRKKIDGAITDFYYWKSPQQEEVDFVIKQGTRITSLIQVCYVLESLSVKKRECRALMKASQELLCDHLIIVTDDYAAEETFEWFGVHKRIQFVPLWEWLLQE